MSLFCKIEIPSKAEYIIHTLQAAGFEAYVVGGCVRDSLLGKEPKDWDITTSATPEQVKEHFFHTIDTGIQHGTVTVMMEKEGFEVTTYRIDGKYEDGRHPTEVIFTPSLTEDLKRRDFTINAMAYNEEEGIVDLFGGMEDLNRGIIRCVGNPEERFTEDALRIMRGVRFAAQLGYEIDCDTRVAMQKLAGNLEKISAERIQTELVKLITSDHPEFLRIAYECGITKVVFPEFDAMMEQPQKHPHHMYSVGEHTLVAMENSPKDKSIRLAMLFHDIGKPRTLTLDLDGTTHFHMHAVVGESMAKNIMRRLKFDNDTMRMVCRLVRFHDYGNGVEPTPKIVRRAIHKAGEEVYPTLFDVRYADLMAQSEYKRQEKLDTLAKWREIYEQIYSENQCVSLKTLAVNGSDLIAMGVQPGKEIGKTLDRLLEYVLDNPEQNQKDILLEYLKNR